MAWYKTGTITVTNGSTTVTGSGTQFITNVAIGEALYAPDGRLYEITNVASDTAFTISPAYLGSTQSGQEYTIVPSQSYIRDLAAQAADLVNNYSTIANFAGQGKFGDGTLTAPGIRYSDDLDTGFFRSAANEVTFVAGGVAQFKYNTSGISFVGGSGIDLTTFSIDGTTVTASGAELNILDGATVTTAELNVLDGITATTAELNYTDGVTSNIQTQLNTKAPSADPTFSGDLEYTGTLTGSTGVINIGSGQVYKDASGNVGIGTSSPEGLLDVAGTVFISSSDGNSGGIIQTSGETGAANKLVINSNRSSGALILQTANAERARITSSGNVGIGTSSPSERLDVNGGVRIRGDFVQSGAVQQSGIYIGQLSVASNNSVVFLFTTTTGDRRNAFIKISVNGRTAGGAITNQPAAEYWFRAHKGADDNPAIANVQGIYQYQYVQATHFSAAGIGNNQFEVVLADPVGLPTTITYKVEILSYFGSVSLTSVFER